MPYQKRAKFLTHFPPQEESFPTWRKWNEEWNEDVYFETGLVAVVDKMTRYGEQNDFSVDVAQKFFLFFRHHMLILCL